MKMVINGIQYASKKDFCKRENIPAYRIDNMRKKSNITSQEAMTALLNNKKVIAYRTQEAYDAFDKAFADPDIRKNAPWTEEQKSILKMMVAQNATIEEMVFATRRSRRSVLAYIAKHNLQNTRLFSNEEIVKIVKQKKPKTSKDIADLVTYTGANLMTIRNLARKHCGYGHTMKYEKEIAFLAKLGVPTKDIAAKLKTTKNNVYHIAWICNIQLVKERNA